jgi:hypothetical protein
MNGCKPFPVMGSVEFLWITMISSCGDHSTVQNALSFAEEKFCLVMCSRYIRNFLPVCYGKLLTFVDISLQGHFCAASCSNK